MSTPLYSEQRQAVQANSQALIIKAQTADRQARSRVRTLRMKKTDWDNLSEEEQAAEITRVEAAIMESRVKSGTDADSRITAIIDEEAEALQAIDNEEIEEKLNALPPNTQVLNLPQAPAKEERDIAAILQSNMVPVIERWERYIVAAGSDLEPTVTDEELALFQSRVSNPNDIREYIAKWNDEDIDVNEDLKEVEREDEDGDDIEVVVSDDEEEDEGEEDKEMADFIVADDEDE